MTLKSYDITHSFRNMNSNFAKAFYKTLCQNPGRQGGASQLFRAGVLGKFQWKHYKQMSKFRVWHPKHYQILKFLPLRVTTSIPVAKNWKSPPPPQGQNFKFMRTLKNPYIFVPTHVFKTTSCIQDAPFINLITKKVFGYGPSHMYKPHPPRSLD